MNGQSFIVLVVDGLRARALGAYGNTLFPTPALDRLASESLLVENYLGETTKLAALYDSLWSGCHAMIPLAHCATPPLTTQLSSAGYTCQLVTDELAVAEHRLAGDFDTTTLLDTSTQDFADSSADTPAGQVLSAAAQVAGEWASEYEQPRMMWVHLRGLTAPWNAPPELAESLVDEDDPELEASPDVPNLCIDDADLSADEIFLASCRYAGQVMALDDCLGAFLDLIADLWPEDPPAVMLAGGRGFALGEHNHLGLASAPYSEQFHVPLLFRGFTGAIPLMRHRGLVQPSQLVSPLGSFAEGNELELPSTQLATGTPDKTSLFLRTDQWHFTTNAETGDSQLFVKPDDLWEANDVASLCFDEAAQIEQLTQRVLKAVEQGEDWRHWQLAEG